MYSHEVRIKILLNMLETIKPGGVLVVTDAEGVFSNDSSETLYSNLFKDGKVKMLAIVKKVNYNKGKPIKIEYRVFQLGSFKSYEDNTPDACCFFNSDRYSIERFEKNLYETTGLYTRFKDKDGFTFDIAIPRTFKYFFRRSH